MFKQDVRKFSVPIPNAPIRNNWQVRKQYELFTCIGHCLIFETIRQSIMMKTFRLHIDDLSLPIGSENVTLTFSGFCCVCVYGRKWSHFVSSLSTYPVVLDKNGGNLTCIGYVFAPYPKECAKILNELTIFYYCKKANFQFVPYNRT